MERRNFPASLRCSLSDLFDGQVVQVLRRHLVPQPKPKPKAKPKPKPTKLRWQLRREDIDVHNFGRFSEKIRGPRHQRFSYFAR